MFIVELMWIYVYTEIYLFFLLLLEEVVRTK